MTDDPLEELLSLLDGAADNSLKRQEALEAENKRLRAALLAVDDRLARWLIRLKDLQNLVAEALEDE